MSILHAFFRGIDRLAPARTAHAHCDIPCGIYDPHHAQLAAHTVIRMNLLINELKKPGPNAAAEERQDYANKLSRYVATKEQHAEIAKHEVRILWADYFKPELLEMFGLEVVGPEDPDFVLRDFRVLLLRRDVPRELVRIVLPFLRRRVRPGFLEFVDEEVHADHRVRGELGVMRVVDPARDVAVGVCGPRGGESIDASEERVEDGHEAALASRDIKTCVESAVSLPRGVGTGGRGRRIGASGGEPLPRTERNVHEAHEDWNLDEGSDHRGKGLARSDPENADRRRDRELEIVARRREREGGRLLVAEPEALREAEGEREHDQEVQDEGHRDR